MGLLPGPGKILWGPKGAADGGDGVAEGGLGLVVPGGGVGLDGVVALCRQVMRPDVIAHPLERSTSF